MSTVLTVAGMRATQVLYEIRLPPPDHHKLFYVGVCHIIDLPKLKDAHSNSEFRRITNGSTPINVSVLLFDHDLEKLNIMQEVLGATAWCNANSDPTNDVRTTKQLRCVETGVIYRNASHVAKELMITPQAVSMHLSKGQPRKLKELTFERVI